MNPRGWGNGRDYSDKMEYLVGLGLTFEEPDFLKEPKYLGISKWNEDFLNEAEIAIPSNAKMDTLASLLNTIVNANEVEY